jgi:hypothetical protein
LIQAHELAAHLTLNDMKETTLHLATTKSSNLGDEEQEAQVAPLSSTRRMPPLEEICPPLALALMALADRWTTQMQ